MADELKPYLRRFWRRFWKDAAPWARDNIAWGAVMLIGPPLAVFVHNRSAQIDWDVIRAGVLLYAIALGIYSVIQMCRVPEKLDAERDAREKSLIEKITTDGETIKQLTTPPLRTAAEQADYETARKAMKLLGDKGITALRHLRRAGSMKLNALGVTGGSSLPQGLTLSDTNWVYNHCHAEGLLACSANLGMGEKTFTISPKMEKVLDDILYENNAAFAG